MTPEQREEFDSLTVLAGSASALTDTLCTLDGEISAAAYTLDSLHIKRKGLVARLAIASEAASRLVALKAPPVVHAPAPETVVETVLEETDGDESQEGDAADAS